MHQLFKRMGRAAVFSACIGLFQVCVLHSQSHADESDALVGRIWDVSAGEFVSFSAVRKRIMNRTYILLGETHGRSAHQNRVAFIIGALAESGRYPTIVLEVLTHEQTETVKEYRMRSPEYSLGLAVPLRWYESGWPSWNFYHPVFDVVFAAKLPIVGADLTETEKDRAKTGNLQHLEVNSSDARLEYYRHRMKNAHCGRIDQDRSTELARVQIARDEQMARVLQESSHPEEGALLLAGASHVRKGTGIPSYLPHDESVVVLMKETASSVEEFNESPEKSVKDGLEAYDYIWFTPSADHPSVCS